MNPAYQSALQYLFEKGKHRYGNRFTIQEADLPVICRLICWFMRDHVNALRIGLDFTKGILLNGPVGCGKTSLMELMQTFRNELPPYTIKPCRDISFEFQKGGFGIVHKYSALEYQGTGTRSMPKIYCFDDLGTELTLKHFGQECNVMTEILSSRYEHYIHNDMITHITTNLNADEIEEVYGLRVRSRLRQMCNLIAFPPETPDKRQ